MSWESWDGMWVMWKRGGIQGLRAEVSVLPFVQRVSRDVRTWIEFDWNKRCTVRKI